MGEFEFIDMVRRSFAGIGDGAMAGFGGGEGILGIGDDCAVIPIGGGMDRDTPGGMDDAAGPGSPGNVDGPALVVTTDMLIEDIHFQRHTTPARELGAKSLAVNLSDVAAMGARPVASFLSLALPADCRGEWASEFMAGYREMSARHGVKLAGGDTTASKNGIAINVVAVGAVPRADIKFRRGARVGDVVAVNGLLGESAAGLQDILSGRSDTFFAGVHRNPVPQVAEGQWLGGRPEVHSMMDISDGLASDLVHILRASSGEKNSLERGAKKPERSAINPECGAKNTRNLAAEIDLGAIPTPVAIELAVAGGEDYKLLLTVAAEGWEALSADYFARFGAPLHPVGRIVEGPDAGLTPTDSPDITTQSPIVEGPGTDLASGGKTDHGDHPVSDCDTDLVPRIIWLENGVPVEKDWRGFTHF